jgi:hypothetical protein
MAENRKINELNDRLIAGGVDIDNSTFEDFLKWAYSDLCDDANKGIFAEWLAAKLLKILPLRRYGWANSDLISARGTKIEIKSGSYWQSWKAINPDGTSKNLNKSPIQPDAKIRFAGLAAKDTIEPHKDKVARLKSDLYIFCFQHEKDYLRWNAMDLSQWEFYLVPASELKTRSVNLCWLKTQKYGPLDPKGLVPKFQEYEDSHARRTSII